MIDGTQRIKNKHYREEQQEALKGFQKEQEYIKTQIRKTQEEIEKFCACGNPINEDEEFCKECV